MEDIVAGIGFHHHDSECYRYADYEAECICTAIRRARNDQFVVGYNAAIDAAVARLSHRTELADNSAFIVQELEQLRGEPVTAEQQSDA